MHQPPFSQAHIMSTRRTLTLGLVVLCSELKWIFIVCLRKWEISQLQKRLSQEFRNLGMVEAVTSGLDIAKAQQQLNIFDEKELALKQISFLLDEIQYLSSQLTEERQEYIRDRVRKWNYPDLFHSFRNEAHQ
jgi:hypothetical protein